MADEELDALPVVRPTSQVDLEERLARDHKAGSPEQPLLNDDGELTVQVRSKFRVEGNDTSAYVGVDPIYMNYANETEKPYPFEGVEGRSVEQMLGNQFAVGVDTAVEGEHTLGSGSNNESVYTATSGEDFVPAVVDRAALAEEEKVEEKKEEEKPAPSVSLPQTPRASA